jgi:hypothetical protein
VAYSYCIFTIPTNTKCSDRNDPVYRAELEAECGILGVMDVPEGFLESEVRHCREHPSFAPDYAARLEKEAVLAAAKHRGKHRHAFTDYAATDVSRAEPLSCWSGSKQYGCTDGYCWRACGSTGNRCWLAADSKGGAQLSCSVDEQCTWDIGVCSEGVCETCV